MQGLANIFVLHVLDLLGGIRYWRHTAQRKLVGYPDLKATQNVIFNERFEKK